LGLFDDLTSGQSLGTAATLWPVCFILIDIVERRLIWRDYWIDWLIAAIAVAICLCGGWAWAAIAGSAINPGAILPQYALSILFIPATMRVCAMLDHWRLRT
jgi:rod shape-determining protein MreD